VAPHTHFFPADIRYQHEQARLHGGLPKNSGLLSTGEPSFRSHLHLLRQGVTTVAHHPQGYGLGNAGVTAVRFGAPLKAGESTYTELGVEIGVAGLAVFLAWMAAVLLALWRRSAWLSAAWVAMLAIGIQTDVIGVHWIAYVLFALAGAAVGGGLPDDEGDDDERIVSA
jgi:hypothetical protein